MENSKFPETPNSFAFLGKINWCFCFAWWPQLFAWSYKKFLFEFPIKEFINDKLIEFHSNFDYQFITLKLLNVLKWETVEIVQKIENYIFFFYIYTLPTSYSRFYYSTKQLLFLEVFKIDCFICKCRFIKDSLLSSLFLDCVFSSSFFSSPPTSAPPPGPYCNFLNASIIILTLLYVFSINTTV